MLFSALTLSHSFAMVIKKAELSVYSLLLQLDKCGIPMYDNKHEQFTPIQT